MIDPMRVLAKPAFETRDRNPYNWLLYTHMQDRGVHVDEYRRSRLLTEKYDVWHLHWPEMHLNDASLSRAIRLSLTTILMAIWVHIRGGRVIWTVHNLRSHERRYPIIERLFWRNFVRQIDGYICLSERSVAEVKEEFPHLTGKPGFVVPHGHYRGFYHNQVSREQARAFLGIPGSAKVILHIGQIRSYKNVPELIEAFRKLEDDDLILVVAGEPWSDVVASEIERARGGDERVRVFEEFVPTDRIQNFMNAADLVVLPYRTMLNSGSAILALSFDCPVMVPAFGSMVELQGYVGERWIRTYYGSLEASELAAALDWACAPRESAPLDPLDWPHIAEQTKRAFQTIRRVAS
jgi:beta-1,4-mannosyltransferase